MSRSRAVAYIAGTAMIVGTMLVLLPFRGHVNTATIALAFVIVVLLTATIYGSLPALTVSILSMMVFNYFFIPPYHTFTIADPQNWVALFVFLLTSVIAGSLSAKEKRRAEEAEKLYMQLQEAFQKASEAEALKQSEQLKSALLDAVSHDLRTPLTSMKAAVTTVLSRSHESTLDEEGRRDLLEVIDAEIDRLNRLVEELIQMAKIEAGAIQPYRAWTNLEEILSNCLDRTTGIASQHKLVVNMEADLPLVQVDEKAIAEVLYILIENATKFSPSNTEINLAVSKIGAGIQLSVEDSGIGIPLHLREKVFDKFFRFSGPSVGERQLRPPGLGMGLAIARAIVEAHHGRIWVEEPGNGQGVRVLFTIPMQHVANAIGI